MNNVNNDSSDIKKAAEQANSQEIEKNLETDKSVNEPESLTEDEETPFIDEALRTDK